MHGHRTDPACSRRTLYLHGLRTRFSPFMYRFSPYWDHFDNGNIASMCSQYGLKQYANGLKWYANGASPGHFPCVALPDLDWFVDKASLGGAT